jgi:hypothetical protein
VVRADGYAVADAQFPRTGLVNASRPLRRNPQLEPRIVSLPTGPHLRNLPRRINFPP